MCAPPVTCPIEALPGQTTSNFRRARELGDKGLLVHASHSSSTSVGYTGRRGATSRGESHCASGLLAASHWLTDDSSAPQANQRRCGCDAPGSLHGRATPTRRPSMSPSCSCASGSSSPRSSRALRTCASWIPSPGASTSSTKGRVWGSRAKGLRLRVRSSGLRVQGSQGSGFRVQGSGLRVVD